MTAPQTRRRSEEEDFDKLALAFKSLKIIKCPINFCVNTGNNMSYMLHHLSPSIASTLKIYARFHAKVLTSESASLHADWWHHNKFLGKALFDSFSVIRLKKKQKKNLFFPRFLRFIASAHISKQVTMMTTRHEVRAYVPNIFVRRPSHIIHAVIKFRAVVFFRSRDSSNGAAPLCSKVVTSPRFVATNRSNILITMKKPPRF